MRFLFWPRLAVLFVFALLAAKPPALHAQDTLVNSRLLIAKGIAAHDSGQYRAAVALFRQVNETDTNYLLALSEIINSCEADSDLWAEGLVVARNARLLTANAFRRDITTRMANLLDYAGKHDSARYWYQQLTVDGPYDHRPYFEQGILLIRQEKTLEAIPLLERSLVLNPLHPGSHRALATVMLAQGRFAEAYLAFATALCFEKDPDRAASIIRSMASIAKGDLRSQDAMLKRPKDEFWEDLDQLIQARLHLRDEYRVKSIMRGEQTVRALYAIVEKLSNVDPSADTSFVGRYYAPLYASLLRDDQFDPLVLFMFSGYGIEAVDKEAEKNRKQVDQARSALYAKLRAVAETGETDPARQQRVQVRRAFRGNDPGDYLLGEVISNDPLRVKAGNYKAYSDHLLTGEGTLNSEGERNGVWTTYYTTGERSAVYHFVNGKQEGEQRKYYPSGILRSRTIFRNDKAVEEYLFTDNGTPDYADYAEYERKGGTATIISLYANGRAVDTTLKDLEGNVLDGIVTSRDALGRTTRRVGYADGKQDGPFKTWHPATGQVAREGALRNGELDGPVTNYHPNGRMSVKANYRRGKPDGVVEEYDDAGRLTERSTYRNGKNETSEYFDPETGKPYGLIRYNGSAPASYRFGPQGGAAWQEATLTGRGNETVVATWPDGTVMSRVQYRNGKAEGEATYYRRDGTKSTTKTYRDDEAYGYTRSYARNGALIKEHFYSTTAPGRYRRWRDDATLLEEGYLDDNGNAFGNWKVYYRDGKVQEERPHRNGQLHGANNMYRPDGTLHETYYYQNGALMAYAACDTNGKLIKRSDFPEGNGEALVYDAGGYQNLRIPVRDGGFHGTASRTLPNGTVTQRLRYCHGRLDSTYTFYHPNGLLSNQQTEVLGRTEGLVSSYDELGLLLRETTKVADEEEGAEKVYLAGTLLRIYNNRDGALHGPQYFLAAGSSDTVAIAHFENGSLVAYQVRGAGGGWAPRVPMPGGTGRMVASYAGKPALDIGYKNSELQGRYQSWYTNGQMAEDLTYHTGLREGQYRKWYDNGKLYYETTYRHGQEEGQETTWSKDGTVGATATYQNGVLHGPATFRKKDGRPDQMVHVRYHYNIIAEVK